jgi:hypothetical protein
MDTDKHGFYRRKQSAQRDTKAEKWRQKHAGTTAEKICPRYEDSDG